MSEQTLEVVRIIRDRLRRASLRIDTSELLFGLILMLAVATGAWVLLAAAESVLWMSLGARRAAMAVWLLLVGATAVTLVFPPLLRLTGLSRMSAEEGVALRIGRRFPEISDRLINLLQLSSGHAGRAPESLVDGAVAMLGRQVEAIRFEAVEDFQRPRKAALRAAVAPVALLLFASIAPGPFADASQRLVALQTEFEPPAPFALRVEPGDVDLTRGESLTISARAEGRLLPADAIVYLHAEGVEHPEQLAMESPTTGRFEYAVAAVRNNLRYRVEADGISSPWYEVRVIERPFIRSLQLRIEPPAYTGQAAQDLIVDRGDVTALRGTRVRVQTRVAGSQLNRVLIEFDDGESVEMDLEQGIATGTFVVEREAAYRIIAESEAGVRNADPIVYRIEPLADEPPTVRLVQPGAEETLGESLEALLGGQIVDDFGFTRLQLRFRLAESRYRKAQEDFQAADLSIETPRPLDQAVVHAWRLSQTGLDPVPGDIIEYYLEVWDNDAYSGPKPGRSAVHRLRVPSLSERYDELDRHQDATQDEMQRLLEEASEIREDFDKIRDELRSKQDADWQDRRQVEALQQRQEALEQRVDEMTRQMEDATRQMEENNLLSEETVEMYRELTRVVEEIKSPELMDALRQLQEAIEQLDLSRMQESMEEFQFNEQQYRQRLERSLELFKRARAMQHLEQAERMASELAKRQEELREATERSRQEEQASTPIDPDQREEEDGRENEEDAARESEPADPEGREQEEESNEGSDQEPSQDAESPSDQAPEETPADAAPSREQAATEQERLSEEMEQLEEKLDEVRKQMNETRSSPKEQMEQLRERVRQQQLPEEMRKTGQQIRSNRMQDAGRSQQNMQQQLQQLQQQLGEMRSSMSGAQLQMNMSGLRRTIRDIISLSQEQEGLQNATVEKGAGSPALREMARTQVRLAEGVGVVADSIQSLAKDIPQMSRDAQRHTGEALREMGRATEALAERSSRQAGTHQRAGMTHLNELALMLSDLLDQLMSQQSGEGGGGMSVEEMADQLQQMSQEQQRLNQQIQQMLNDMHGDRISSDMQERLRQMSAQQDQIRRHLRQLSRDPLARDGLANELNRIADQMQETIEELQRRGASRETIERQQQILTRLLEAERSLQEREQDERRRGRTGEDVSRESPAEIERSQEMERLRRDLLRALESDYSPDYQELIRRYFELLRRETEGSR